MRLYRAADRVARPWKNGGGITRDVALSPPGAQIEDFDWRISMATVASDGPFSHFQGIDRTLAVLTGEGIKLHIGKDLAELTPASEPYSFSGDVPAAGTLLGRTITDLNVMSRRGVVRHQVSRIVTETRLDLPFSLDEALLLWVKGSGTVETPEGGVRLEPYDALHATRPGQWAVVPEGNCLVYFVRFTPAVR